MHWWFTTRTFTEQCKLRRSPLKGTVHDMSELQNLLFLQHNFDVLPEVWPALEAMMTMNHNVFYYIMVRHTCLANRRDTARWDLNNFTLQYKQANLTASEIQKWITVHYRSVLNESVLLFRCSDEKRRGYFLNSRIISASLAPGTPGNVLQKVTITLKHTTVSEEHLWHIRHFQNTLTFHSQVQKVHSPNLSQR